MRRGAPVLKDVFLINRGDALVPASPHGEEVLAQYPLGASIRAKLTRERQLPHHNFYWAFISHVLVNWPEEHELNVTGRDEKFLHAWMAVRAGWYETTGFEPPAGADEIALRFAVRVARRMVIELAGDKPVWSKVINGMIEFRWPKSIAFKKMKQDEFSLFTTDVFTKIYAETGIDVDDYYSNWAKHNKKLEHPPFRRKSDAEVGAMT